MSLVALAEQARAPRAIFRVVLVTVAVIAGLLAMHALNTHATATGHGVTASASVMAHDHGPDAVARESAHAAHTPVARGPAAQPDDHDMAWMTCVLALLSAILVLAAARVIRFTTAARHLAWSLSARWPASAHPLPPPSLTVLCVSRT